MLIAASLHAAALETMPDENGYQNTDMEVSWAMSSKWVKNTRQTHYLVQYDNVDFGAEAVLEAVNLDLTSPQTISEIVQARAVAYYDTWELVATRDASRAELMASGAENQAKVLYRKKYLKNGAFIEKLLVLEHYFIFHNRIYVITLSVPQQYWQNVSSDFELMLSNFCLGSIKNESLVSTANN